MSFFKPKDFATYIGRRYTTVRSHINRGKIHKSADGFIDSTHPTNELYIKEFAANKIETPPAPTNKKQANENLESQSPLPDFSKSEAGPESAEVANLTLRKKKADAIKAERDAELKRIDIEKKTGQLMPTDLVQKILQINLASVFRAFDSSAENIASIYTERLGGNRADLADITTRMRSELERSINDAKEVALKEIKGAIREYSETRSRGEKK